MRVNVKMKMKMKVKVKVKVKVNVTDEVRGDATLHLQQCHWDRYGTEAAPTR